MSLRQLVRSQWPIVTVVLIFSAAFTLVAANFWRRGALLIGIGVGVAAVLRLALTEDSGHTNTFDPLLNWARNSVPHELPARLYSRRKIA